MKKRTAWACATHPAGMGFCQMEIFQPGPTAHMVVQPMIFPTLEDVDSKSSATVFFESKTEMALLKFTKDLGWANYKEMHDTTNVTLIIPFSSERKSIRCVV